MVWTATLLSRVLKQEAYTGMVVQGKYICNGKHKTMLPPEKWIRHESKHPVIIDRAKFDAVQELMEESAKRYEKNGNYGPMPENRYKGKIFCSRCNKSVSRLTNGGKRPGKPMQLYYRCSHCYNELKFALGLNRIPKFNLSALDEIIMAVLLKQLDVLLNFNALIEDLVSSEQYAMQRINLTNEKSRLEKVITSADKTLSTAYAHHLDGILGVREFELVRTKVESDKKEAATKLVQVESEIRKQTQVTDRRKHWQDICSRFKGGENEAPTREMIEALIHRIELMPLTNEIDIVLNFSNELEEYGALLEAIHLKESEVVADA
jgi:hypothetical protein